jgi:hypothetical protein
LPVEQLHAVAHDYEIGGEVANCLESFLGEPELADKREALRVPDQLAQHPAPRRVTVDDHDCR